MKTFVSLFFVCFFCQALFSECSDKSESIPYTADLSVYANDTLLSGIEKKIYDAFVQSMMTQKEEPLLGIKAGLEKLYAQKNQNLILYWQAYLGYYRSIYALKGNREKSEAVCDEWIDVLDKMKNKNSEDYALLALLKSFSIQFKSGVKAPFISSSVADNTEKSLALDAKNLRAHYVDASSDFYTPEQYGGGKKAEALLLKAITLPSQAVQNAYLPSWGKEESYDMLIKLYIKKEKWNEAKKYWQEATSLYPKSYTIAQLATKLVGK